MNTWIGPALIAAVISSLVTAIGWLVNYRTSLGLEKERRVEKVRDFQIALRAEIRSEMHHLDVTRLEEGLAAVESRYRKSKTYSVFVLGIARHVVFENLVKELHVLPEQVIDPVVLYYRQRQLIEQAGLDLRSERFGKCPQAQQLEMYRDYIGLMIYLHTLAQEANRALNGELND
jgi:hypothetical protein